MSIIIIFNEQQTENLSFTYALSLTSSLSQKHSNLEIM